MFQYFQRLHDENKKKIYDRLSELKENFTSHPNEVCMSYYSHLTFSSKLSIVLFISSIKAFVHAIVPSFYVTSTSDTIDYIKSELIKNGCEKDD